jgi:hypothetical protein
MKNFAIRGLMVIIGLIYLFSQSIEVTIVIVSGGVCLVTLGIWVKRVFIDKREEPFSPASGYLWMGLSLAVFMAAVWYFTGGMSYIFP